MANFGGFALMSSKTVARGRVFRVDEEWWRDAEGKFFTRQNVTHPGAVAILPFSAPGRVVLIRQFRPSVRRWLLEVPAGTLEKGESPLACAKRELTEEIGFAARKWKKMGAILTAPGFCSEKIHLFAASDLRPCRGEQDEDEHIETVEMPLEKAYALARKGTIRDGKTLSALFLFQKRS